MDYSTLNREAMLKLPVWEPSSFYHPSQSMGNGCAGDPPGFPSYFTRSVYNNNGNSPYIRNVPGQVILYEDSYRVISWSIDDYDSEKYFARLKKLWNPLPLDHERTRLWIHERYRHHHSCYRDAEREEYGRPGTLIYPVPNYKLKLVPTWEATGKMSGAQTSEAWEEAKKLADAHFKTVLAETQAFNAAEIARARAVAVPDNHQAVVIIRKFYPDYQPELNLIEKPEKNITTWWETQAQAPEQSATGCRPRWGTHPMNGNWCQHCGWRKPEPVEV